jgi:hypothetical protein
MSTPVIVLASRLADRYVKATEAAQKAATELRDVEALILKTYPVGSLLVGNDDIVVSVSETSSTIVDWESLAHDVLSGWPVEQRREKLAAVTRTTINPTVIIKPVEREKTDAKA